MSFTSFSTPVVAAASALLVQTAHETPLFSNGSYTPARFPGTTIYHGETSEVVKAALLAGASRLVFNSNDGSAIVDYREATSRQSNNGLDKRFGAGQLNVYNSISIISGGEQNSLADGGPISIATAGFDYDSHFGGMSGANGTGTYDFTAGWTGQTLTATLAWNAKIDIQKVKQNDPVNAATVYDLNLSLYDITQTPTLVASSTSPSQNTENIWASLVSGRRYRLEVSRGAGQAPFDWDYGLAWSTVGTIGWQGLLTNIWSEGVSFSWTKGNLPAGYLPGEHVVFGDWGVNGQVRIAGSVAPGSVMVDNNTRPYVFMGGSISGATGLVKRGPGLLSVTNANTYAGATLVQAGRLALYVDGGLGSTSQGTTVSPGASLSLPGGVNYSLPEPLTISGQGPTGQGALENSGGDNLFAGPVTVSGNATIGATSGNLALTGRVTLPASTTLDKNGPGVLSLRGGIDWGSSSGIRVTAGTLRLEPVAGSVVTVSNTAPTLTVAGGAAHINSLGQYPLTDTQSPWQRVNIVNNVPNGLVIEAGAVFAGELTGPGSTIVNAGAHLITDRISQSGLSIGAGGRVSLRPGSGTSSIHSLGLNAVIALVPEENIVLSTMLSSESMAAPNSAPGDIGAIGSAVSIPEPGSLALGAVILLVVLGAAMHRLAGAHWIRHRRT
jgi:autotransporter-associated beta strand protein